MEMCIFMKQTVVSSSEVKPAVSLQSDMNEVRPPDAAHMSNSWLLIGRSIRLAISNVL